MTGTYPVHTYLKRVGLANSAMCPHCTGRVPETLTHFACVCPQFLAARTSAHHQVRQVISFLFPIFTDSNWTVFEETHMDLKSEVNIVYHHDFKVNYRMMRGGEHQILEKSDKSA
jgi:hypothetical protein